MKEWRRKKEEEEKRGRKKGRIDLDAFPGARGCVEPLVARDADLQVRELDGAVVQGEHPRLAAPELGLQVVELRVLVALLEAGQGRVQVRIAR